jgi:hypothetical protein
LRRARFAAPAGERVMKRAREMNRTRELKPSPLRNAHWPGGLSRNLLTTQRARRAARPAEEQTRAEARAAAAGKKGVRTDPLAAGWSRGPHGQHSRNRRTSEKNVAAVGPGLRSPSRARRIATRRVRGVQERPRTAKRARADLRARRRKDFARARGLHPWALQEASQIHSRAERRERRDSRRDARRRRRAIRMRARFPLRPESHSQFR